jgi:hypothetical protein
MRALLALLLAFLTALALLACTIMNDRHLPRRTDAGDVTRPRADGAPEDEGGASDAGCPDDLPFRSPAPITELNTAGDESLPRLTADERTLFFYRFDNDGGATLHQTTRPSADAKFDPPTRLFPLVEGARMGMPSADGRRLYFTAGYDSLGLSLHLAERPSTGQPFTTERLLLAFTDTASFGTPFLYEGVGGPQLFLVRSDGNDDLLRAQVDALGGINPQALAEIPEVNTTAAEFDPVLSANGLTLYFYSEREAPGAGGRIFVTHRASTNALWGPPEPLPEIAKPPDGWVGPGWISGDNCRLYYYESLDAFTADLWTARRR